MTSLRPLAHGAIAAILLLLVVLLAFAQDGPFVFKVVQTFPGKDGPSALSFCRSSRFNGPVVGGASPTGTGSTIHRPSRRVSLASRALHLGGLTLAPTRALT